MSGAPHRTGTADGVTAHDHGFTLPARDGFGTHAGRGTPETSCFFTDSVLRAYWAQFGNGSDFLMKCQQYTGDEWITCTGGQSARVYLW